MKSYKTAEQNSVIFLRTYTEVSIYFHTIIYYLDYPIKSQ